MFIRSERLFLRPCWPEDCVELFALVGPADGARGLGRDASIDAECIGTRGQSPSHDRLLPHFLVTLPGSSGAKLIGAASLARFDGDVEIFTCIAPQERCRGYATEAVRAVTAQARALGHHRIVAAHFPDDKAGERVFTKAGFRPTGATRPRQRVVHGERFPAVEVAIALRTAGGGDDPLMRAA